MITRFKIYENKIVNITKYKIGDFIEYYIGGYNNYYGKIIDMKLNSKHIDEEQTISTKHKR